MENIKNIIFTVLIIVTFSCAQNDNKKTVSASSPTASVVDGAKIFKKSCVVCHGEDGKLGLNGSKDLTQSEVDLDTRIVQITKGKGLMTPFEHILSAEEIIAVAEYTITLKGQ